MSKLQNRVRLTAGRVDAFTCPAGKSQAFLWDTEAPALALRVTPTGRKTYVFESRLNGATLRLNIGTATDWPIEKARGEAQRLKMLVDSGTDPRELERQQQAAQAAERAAAVAKVKADKVAAVTVGEVWADYLGACRTFPPSAQRLHPRQSAPNHRDLADEPLRSRRSRHRLPVTTVGGRMAAQ